MNGPYCSACGQHDVDYHRSFGHIVEDSLEGFFHFDGKFLKSMRYLFTRPGFLTTEFLAGRRARYAHPLRFYIFASFVFFAGSALTESKSAVKVNEGHSARAGTIDARNGPDKPQPADAAAQEAKPDKSNGSSKWDWLEGNVLKAQGAYGSQYNKVLTREIGHLLPTMLFLCMPVLAALLKLAYLKSGRLYMEHLIFALHTITLVYLSALVATLGESAVRLASSGAAEAIGLVCFCLTAWLIWRSFLAVYAEGKWKTLLKLAFIAPVFGIILLLGVGAVSVASFYILAREA